MALYQPQPPQPYLGGQQPLTARKLAPSLALVPNPPFSEPQRKPVYIALRSLAEPPPPDPFEGERQPLTARKLTPSLLLVPNPPFRNPRWATYNALVRQLWEPTVKTPVFLSSLVQGVAVTPVGDNPPFGLPPVQLWNLLRAWEPPPAQVTQARLYVPQPLVIVGADNPPFGMTARLWTVLRTWEPAAKTPVFLSSLIQEGIVVPPTVDNPPFGMPPRWFLEVLAYWQLIPPPIILAKNLSPGIPGLSVDNPPGRIFDLRWHKEAHWIVVGGDLYAAIRQVPAPVNNPPFGMPPDWLNTVLDIAWKPGPPRPKLSPGGPIVQEGPPPAPIVFYDGVPVRPVILLDGVPIEVNIITTANFDNQVPIRWVADLDAVPVLITADPRNNLVPTKDK